MKVSCKSSVDRYNIRYNYLIINKIYDVISQSNSLPGSNYNYYAIDGDDGERYSAPSYMFEPIRNINLDKLLKEI